MNITCAYCHIKGHHIKFCKDLAEKNRRREACKNKTYNLQVARYSLPTKPLPKNTTNIFADLDRYSSEEEEGEIVEEDRKSRRKNLESKYSSADDASVHSASSVETSWSRRGTKGTVITIPKVTREEKEFSESEYTPSETLLQYLEYSREFLRKYDGMSWADIEYYSDSE